MQFWLNRLCLIVAAFGFLATGPQSVAHAQLEVGATQDANYPYYRYPKMIPPHAFARPDGILSAKISPDGRHMITSARQEKGVVLEVQATQPEAREKYLRVTTDGDGIQNAHWLDNEHIFLETKRWRYSSKRGFYPSTMIQIFRFNQSNVMTVAHFDMKESNAYVETMLLHALPADPDHVLIAASPNEKSRPAVYRMNIHDASLTMVEKNRRDISLWMADTQGNVRFGMGFEDKSLTIIAKPTPDAPWKSLKDNKLFQNGRFYPVFFDFDDRRMIVRTAAATGRFALYRMDLDSGRITDRLFEHPDVDVLTLERSAASQKNLAVTYIDDRMQRHFLDDDYKALFDKIEAALPGRSHHVLNQSADGRYILIKSLSDRYPGAIYRFDTRTMEMSAVAEINSSLNPRLLAPRQRINYFARDGLEIPGYLTTPLAPTEGKLPAVVLPHGGPRSRDTVNYDRMAQFLASRGFVVLQPNYRGSTGYSFEFEALGFGQWGGAIQNDIEDAAKYLIAEGIADPDRLCIVGESSFDAYSALLGVLKTPDLFTCGVAISPIFDLRSYVRTVKRWYGKNAGTAVAGDRNSRTLKAISPDTLITSLRRPLLVFYGARDWLVGPKEILKFGEAVEDNDLPVKFLMHKAEGHGISMPGVRMSVYKEIDMFLREHLGSPDQSAFVAPVRQKAQGPSNRTIQQRTASVSNAEQVGRCLPQHFHPFYTTPDSQLAQRAAFCTAVIEQLTEDTSPQLAVSLFVTRAKLQFLGGKMDAFKADLSTARARTNAATPGDVHQTTILALRALETLALIKDRDWQAAHEAAAVLSADAPEFVAGNTLLARVSAQRENLADYMLAKKRLLRRQLVDQQMPPLVNDLLDLGRYEEAKQTIESFMVAQIRSSEVGLMAQYYGEAELGHGNLDAAGKLFAAVQKDRSKADAYLDAVFPNIPSITLRDLGSRLRTREWKNLPYLQALQLYEIGRGDEANEMIDRTALEECGTLVCLKLKLHVVQAEGDDVRVKGLKRLIKRKKPNPYGYWQRGWDRNLVLLLPAVPQVASEGREKAPALHKTATRSNDRMILYFDVEPATDTYSFWLQAKTIAAAEARKKGAAGFVVLKASLGSAPEKNWRLLGTYERARGKFSELEIRLIMDQGVRATDPATNWLMYSAN